MTPSAPTTFPPCRWRRRAALLALAPSLALASAGAAVAQAADWTQALRQEVERIDRNTPGELGLYVKRLADGRTLSYQAGEPWYLSSSAKLPMAIGLLQEVQAGRLSLDQRLALQDGDRIDGAGNVVWQATGTRYSLGALLERTLMQSDNTAANMLVRAMGADTMQQRTKALIGGDGFKGLTDFAQVRRDVYAELHPRAAELPNAALVKIAAAKLGPPRVEAVRRTLGVPRSELKVPTMEAAYDRYYAKGLNAASLEAYGAMLEKLVRGQLLSPEHTTLLYKRLKYDTYDAYRLEAGLPRSERFIHKTGTQYRRACHMGVVNPQDGGRDAVVVTACAKGLDEHDGAAALFEQVGRAITKTVLQPPAADRR
ncbi:serine hydrolase [Aquabacterium sp. J223]|uniref:serine hydrolase n=1 Tax=Aquabacterium sp. J223 TaxID=2898431 RepID=UPI0021AE1A19|nr:serine hydrolase [Aquabacterium sp. J223]UUX96337.1 class A beta-lactamase-related serine hydrolase [Aquabacterium sp. J223]